jgi:hypothetical protein
MPKTARQVSKPALAAKIGKDLSTPGDSGRELMKAVLAKPRKKTSDEVSKDYRINGVVIGTLKEVSEDGQPLVYYPGIPSDKPLPAIATESLAKQENGKEVALGFVNGDPASPIILGLLQKTGKQAQPALQESSKQQSVNVELDGEKLTLTADRELVLQCGKSSITLTRAGKVILKGAYLSTHSTGVNRIKGGSVQIN